MPKAQLEASVEASVEAHAEAPLAIAAAESAGGASSGESMGGPPPCEAGEVILPGYSVTHHLHRGTAFDTYEVWSAEWLACCIAKVPRPDRLDEESVRAILLAEGHLLLALRHPHIVRAYALAEQPFPMLVLEVIPGMPLDDVIADRKRRFSARELAILGQQLASAVVYVHRRGSLHLDLKPANVMIAMRAARLIDFSLARVPGPGHAGAGTPAYLAPEQAIGAHASPATDSWGLGATLYHAATGEPPFPESTRRDYAQLTRRATPLGARRRLPALLTDLVDACLDPAPERRPAPLDIFQTLGALADGPAPRE